MKLSHLRCVGSFCLASASTFVACSTHGEKANHASIAASSKAGVATAVPQSALHNVFSLGPGVYSGSMPESPVAFAELKKLGVKTIVSVDGSTPDVQSAKANGMRYVHIPTLYSGVAEDESLEIARAIRDLPGPVYVHCHHGLHRGPAATAAAMIHLGRWSNEQGAAFLKEAGTSASYPGLFACVAHAATASKEQLDRVPSNFPEVAPVPSFARGMVSIDLAVDNLKQLQKSGWNAPKDHPDLVAAAEAGRVADLLRNSDATDAVGKRDPTTFAALMAEARTRADAMERSLVDSSLSKDVRDERLMSLTQSCKACHAAFRDR